MSFLPLVALVSRAEIRAFRVLLIWDVASPFRNPSTSAFVLHLSCTALDCLFIHYVTFRPTLMRQQAVLI